MAVHAQRTAEELKDPKFNYFIAFAFDITETNSKNIEQKVKTILGDASGTNLHKKRLLELRENILEVMCNDAKLNGEVYEPKKGARKEEAARAKEFKLSEAVEIIQDMCTKSNRKFILVSDLENIRHAANNYFTLDELKTKIDYLQQQGIKIIDNIDKSMPFNKYKEVEDMLKVVKKRDLYEFLGVKANATSDEISAAIKTANSNASKTADLKLKQAISGLCGSMTQLLLNKDAKYRSNYDYYLKLKDSIWEKFKLKNVYGLNLSMEEYEEFVQVAVDALGVTVDEAEKILSVGCNYYKLFVSGKEDESNFDTCPYCNKIYKKGAKSCPHCGKPLEIICWNCGERMAYSKDKQTCPSCGAAKQTEEKLQQKSSEIDALLSQSQPNISKLDNAFLELCNILPDYLSKPNSVVSKKIKSYEDSIKNLKAVEEKLGKSYREDEAKLKKLIAEKKLFSAEALAKTLKQKYLTYNANSTAAFLSSISTELSKIRQFLTIAKGAAEKNDSKTAIANAVKVNELCEDCEESRAILKKYPPNAPTSVRTFISGNSMKIEWSVTAAQENVSFTIIKKIGVCPTGPDDGSIVAENLSIMFYEDLAVVPATKYYYAVFADRCGIKSKLVTTQAPIIYAEVTQIHQEIVNDCIKVTWKAPQNVKAVKVFKKRGNIAPEKIGDGESVSCDLSGFADYDVSGEAAYLIVCEYVVDGNEILSRGIRSVFTPFKVLNKITNARITFAHGNQYIFNSDENANAISMFYSESKQPLPYNKTQRLADFGTVAKGLTKLSTSVDIEGNTLVNLPEGKIGWLYPVAQNEQLFIISEPIVFNTIKGQALEYELLSGSLVVKGNINEKAENLVLKVSNKAFPKTMEDDGECFRYKRVDFVRDGKAELKLKANTLSYVSVFSEFRLNGILSYSQPFVIDEVLGEREKVFVHYKLDYSVSALKQFKLNILFEANSEVTIPSLLLIKGYPRPIDKTEGELVERIEPIQLKKGFFSNKYTGKYTVKLAPTAKNMKFNIFVSDEKCDVRLREVNTL